MLLAAAVAQPDQLPDRLKRLLDQPSVRARSAELRGSVCAATPSLAPGVAETMAEIARDERSVSAANLRLADGTQLGSFSGPEGAFADSRELAAEIYGADEAIVHTGGSTGCNQIVSKALAARGDTVLMVANAHHSTVLALIEDGVDFLRTGVGYDPEYEAAHAVTAEEIRAQLRLHPHVSAVHVVSPTYEGDVADIPAIAAVCHAHGALLIVDSAWGAHFPYHPSLPAPPCALGADIAVTSLHKLGGGPQQTAVLAYRTERVSTAEIEAARMKVDTTSPSMALLGGADTALREMAANGARHLQRTFDLAAELTARALIELPRLTVYRAPAGPLQDPTRVTFGLTGYGLSGFELADALAERGIVCEKASTAAITFLLAMGLGDDAPVLIVAGLREVLSGHREPVAPEIPVDPFAGLESVPAITPGAAVKRAQRLGVGVELTEAVGLIATQVIEVYPPGIPVVVPGFAISRGAIEVITAARSRGGTVQSSAHFDGRVTVIRPADLPSRD